MEIRVKVKSRAPKLPSLQMRAALLNIPRQSRGV